VPGDYFASAINVRSERLTAEQRRARREERRQKQRQANILRAAKMRAARLADAGLAKSKERKIGRKPPARKMQLHIGCSGWFYWHWRERFYPSGTPTKQWFEHYSNQFNTVELNAPFYSWPTVATVRTWVNQAAGKNFVYAVKVCELITHVKRFTGAKRLVEDFGYVADLLGERFGCFLFQLPPSFHFTRARLKNIVSQLDPARKNVVEFRHRTWWNDEVFAAFRKAGIIFCSCSGPRLPDELVKTADEIYVRFHGTKQWYRHDYSKKELAVWTARIQESGATRTWAYFNNDREGNAIRNARQLLRQLKSGAMPD
jgi:uncharacterized protein YecE (DUF72 family)